jgi:signal transduction histidine kinase
MGRIAFSFLLSIAFIPGVTFAEPLLINPDFNGEFIGRHVLHFEDKSRKLTIDDIKSPEYRTKFAPDKQTTLNFGVSGTAHWLYFAAKNADVKNVRWMLQLEYPILSRVEVYEGTADGKYLPHFGGNQLPIKMRDVKSPKNVFSMNTPPGTTDVFVRIAPFDKMAANFTMTAWNEVNFAENNDLANILLGFFYGSLLVLFFYNFFIFLSVRDSSFFWYVLYLGFVTSAFFAANGLGSEYLWGNSPYLGRESQFIFYFCALTSGFLFTRSFLDTRRHSPSMDKVLAGGAVLCAAYALIATAEISFQFNSAVSYPSTLPFPLILTYVGVICLLKGVRQSRFFVAAWSLFLLGMPLYILKDLGVLPDSFATTYSVQIGTLLEGILLSLALADRMNIMRGEKENAEAETMAVLQKSRDELESKVAERTEQLRLAKENAENATALKDKFVALVSHDLKSPFVSIVGLLKIVVLDAKTPLAAGHKEKLERVLTSSNGLVDMIDKLLDINHLQSGKIKPVHKPISLRPFTSQQIESLAHLAARKGVVIKNEMDSEIILKGDPNLLGRCLDNLLSNAIKFCNEGGEIMVFFHLNGGPTIGVSDTGVGIPPGLIPNLFVAEIKTSTIGTAGEKGTGLGLPYCKDIMEAHGGHISVSSEVGKGSTFLLVFPPDPK